MQKDVTCNFQNEWSDVKSGMKMQSNVVKMAEYLQWTTTSRLGSTCERSFVRASIFSQFSWSKLCWLCNYCHLFYYFSCDVWSSTHQWLYSWPGEICSRERIQCIGLGPIRRQRRRHTRHIFKILQVSTKYNSFTSCVFVFCLTFSNYFN